MPIRARPVTTPVQYSKSITAHEDEFIGAVGFLDDAGARDLDLALVQFARPGRDALQVIRSNHDLIDGSRSLIIMLRRNINTPRPLPLEELTALSADKICRPIVRHKTFQTIALPY